MPRKRPKVSLAKKVPARTGDIEELFAGADAVEQASGMRLMSVRLDAIHPDPSQPRTTFTEVRLQELSESIKQDGVIQPIEVTEIERNTYLIVHGERRWRAAQLAGLTVIPAVVRRRDYDSVTRFVRQMVENIQREDLNDVDRAAGLVRLRELMQSELDAEAETLEKQSWSNNVTWADVGRRLGYSRQRIHQLRKLLDLPENIQQDVREGTMRERDTRIYQGLSSDQQVDLHEVRQSDELSQTELEAVARHLKSVEDVTVADAIAYVRQPTGGRSPAETNQPPESRPDTWVERTVLPQRKHTGGINRLQWARDHLSRFQLPNEIGEAERAEIMHLLRLLERDVSALIDAVEASS